MKVIICNTANEFIVLTRNFYPINNDKNLEVAENDHAIWYKGLHGSVITTCVLLKDNYVEQGIEPDKEETRNER